MRLTPRQIECLQAIDANYRVWVLGSTEPEDIRLGNLWRTSSRHFNSRTIDKVKVLGLCRISRKPVTVGGGHCYELTDSGRAAVEGK